MGAEAAGEAWGLRWVLVQDPQDRPDVYCLRSDVVRTSLTPTEFKKLLEEVAQRLQDALIDWVSITIRCNDPNSEWTFETPGAESVLWKPARP